jgi:DNA end-binding protein Ku
MPRAIWTGAISFGLVNVPVRMYSAIQEHKLHFNYIHEKDGSRIGYEKVCKQEGKPVPEGEIVKAFEWEKGEYVPMRDEDFERAQEETYKAIDIRDFVDYEEIDPIYFDKTYYLGPQEGAEKVYGLLVRAMEESGRAAIAKFVMRDRQNLGCLRVSGETLLLEKMYFADEIRPPEGIAPDVKKSDVDKREVEMAQALIDKLYGPFEPEQYKDTYRDSLCEIIKAKREGETIEEPRPEKPKAAPDLMAALQASLEASGSGNGGKKKQRSGDDGLQKLSKSELYERAKKADISGRADMTKDELVAALS